MINLIGASEIASDLKIADFITSNLIPDFAFPVDKSCLIFGMHGSDFIGIPVDPVKTRAGLSSPNLNIFQDADGVYKVFSTLEAGKGSCRIRLRSSAYLTYLDALREIVSAMNSIPIEDGFSPDGDWGGLLVSGRSVQSPSFKNVIEVGFPGYVCSAKRKGKTYVSLPCESKMAALRYIANILNGLPAAEKKVKITKHQTTKKTSPLHNEKIVFERMVSRWKREYTWLISNHARYVLACDPGRISQLQRFLCIADPLRKYEISPIARENSLKEMESELSEYEALTQSKPLLAKYYAAYLSKLIKSDHLEPGVNAVIDLAFSDFANRRGDDPEKIIQQLLSMGFLRHAAGDGIYTLSNRGVTFIQKMLRAGYRENAIGSITSSEVMYALSKIKRK